jgi:hypothetical protein
VIAIACVNAIDVLPLEQSQERTVDEQKDQLMRSRDAVGKRIVKVRQRRFYSSAIAQMDNEVVEIELDDGTLLRPIAYEQEDFNPTIDFVVVKPRRKGKTA